ncbi:Serine/threonine-protein kinase PknD [Dyadobacter sp. CECT 9275]|uniref:Serine/threonine-protein kinase PknD n=1 Tax=Dyadobacter helix TaxID=2822344 RepID=A0A916NCH7_9BACT|nr:serine/threonine-protein kinase [Dyadobacter sp. CECT 9275]CAG5002112.1 Serine/threonine-protein kinase PknD [Dyadobacter sp. CECT 9275]
MSFINSKIKDYTILSEISAKGAQGALYYAQNDLGAEVAIKILHKSNAENVTLRKHFQKEAMIMASLRNDHIVRAMDFYQDEQTVAIIMEYLDGQDLEAYVLEKESKEGSAALPLDIVMKWYGQILPAFEHAHGKGLVHRDVKPSNIFLTSTGNIKVLDFGIAKILEETEMEHIKISSMGSLTTSGTQYYKSPEHHLRPTTVNHLTDIYALGLMFYILTTGEEPYIHEQLMDDVLFKPLGEVPGYPRPVYEVLLKATAKKREERYASCTEFLEALQLAVTAKEGVTGFKTGPTEIVVDESKTPRPEPPKGEQKIETGETLPPPPRITPPPPRAVYRVYSQVAITIAAFIGGGLAVGYMLSRNAKRLDNGNNAVQYFLGAAFVGMMAYMLIPYHKLSDDELFQMFFLIQAVSAVVTYFVVEASQKKLIEKYVVYEGGEYEPASGMIGLLIAFFFINIVVLILALMVSSS